MKKLVDAILFADDPILSQRPDWVNILTWAAGFALPFICAIQAVSF